MPAMMIEIPSVPTRLLTKGEAARYCRLNTNRFSVICPVRPVEIDKNKKVYDIKELDGWIDSLKTNTHNDSDDALIEKLCR